MRGLLLQKLEERLDDLKDLGSESVLYAYLEEEIEEFELVGWDKLKDREYTDDNPHNILAYYLLDKAPKPKELRHHWELGDFPDIDADIDPRYRDKVKQYLAERWGHNNCLDVATYGGIHIKSAIQDLGRVFNLNPSDVARVTTLIKMDVANAENNTLAAVMERYPAVRQFLQKHPEIAENVEKMQEVKRSIGKHASAFVISNENLLENVPIVRGSHKELLIAYPESSGLKALNNLGYIKFDILGLEHVGIVHDAVQLVRERHGVTIDWDKIDVEDPKVFDMLNAGFNAGIFQFNTSTSERTVAIVKPQTFFEMVATTSLIRPAAIQSNAHEYFKMHKRGQYKPDQYPVWKDLKGHISEFTYRLLDMTYGIVTFQEQLMALISDFCDVDFDETNKARKYLVMPANKRNEDVDRYIAWLQNRWFAHMPARIGEDKALQWWNITVGALSYAFNMSHALAYTMIAYRELWLKTYYPHELYESLIRHLPSDIMVYIDEASRLGITVEAPDINRSARDISTIDGRIYLGLTLCKRVGVTPALQIIAKRPYNSFRDFVEKHTYKYSPVNKTVIEALIYANAFRKFGDRKQIWEEWKQIRKIKDDLDDDQILQLEYDVLGIVLSAKRTLDDVPYGALVPAKSNNVPKGTVVDLYGIIKKIDYKTSKSGNPYARIELTDYRYSVTIFVWKNKLNAIKDLNKGDELYVRVKSMGDGSFSVLAVKSA